MTFALEPQRRREASYRYMDEIPAAKRGRTTTITWPLVGSSSPSREDNAMLVDTTSSLGDESSLTQSSTEGSKRSSTIPSADDILVEMIQSGRYTHNQVVHFCLASGIPLSRMLRLDLMRLNKASDTNDLPMDSI